MTILNSLVSKLYSCHAHLLMGQSLSEAYLLGIGKLFLYICSEEFCASLTGPDVIGGLMSLPQNIPISS